MNGYVLLYYWGSWMSQYYAIVLLKQFEFMWKN